MRKILNTAVVVAVLAITGNAHADSIYVTQDRVCVNNIPNSGLSNIAFEVSGNTYNWGSLTVDGDHNPDSGSVTIKDHGVIEMTNNNVDPARIKNPSTTGGGDGILIQTRSKAIRLSTFDPYDPNVTPAGLGFISVHPNGNLYTSAGTYWYSDIKLKEDIEALEGAVDGVSRLQGVSYHKKGFQGREIGLIAQEVEPIYPELVSIEPETGLKAVNYAGFVPVLIEALKEQQQTIQQQQAAIDALEKRLGKIESAF